MKRSFFALLLTVALVFTLASCGSGSSDSADSTEAESTTTERDLPEGDYSDMGAGTMYIENESGTSENGNVPVIYADDETILLQIGLVSEEMDGAKLSYIYVDGMEVATEQLGDTQTSIDLEADQLTEGTHKVEVVQYENDDTSGDMVTYKSAQYEVKVK